MKAKIELILEDGKKETHTIGLKGKPKGVKILDAVEKAVEKEFSDRPWTRWNLQDIIE